MSIYEHISCHHRLNGNCPHMEVPSCLTCGDNQTPCKDLAVGFWN